MKKIIWILLISGVALCQNVIINERLALPISLYKNSEELKNASSIKVYGVLRMKKIKDTSIVDSLSSTIDGFLSFNNIWSTPYYSMDNINTKVTPPFIPLYVKYKNATYLNLASIYGYDDSGIFLKITHPGKLYSLIVSDQKFSGSTDVVNWA